MSEKKEKSKNGRIFMGSWFLVIAPFFIAVIIVWYNFNNFQLANPEKSTFALLVTTFEHVFQTLIYLIGGEILYYFASLVPTKVAVVRAEKLRSSDSIGLFGAIFQDTFKNTTVTTDYYNSAGSYQGSKTQELPGILDLAGVPLQFLIYFIILFVKASLVPYWAIINFFRNYVFVWLFPKRYEIQ